MKMFLSMILKFGVGFLIIGLILFSASGSIYYINGWIFIIALGIPMSIIGIYLLIKDPSTLARRLKNKEPSKEQSLIIILSGLTFIVSFLISGLDFRFEWSKMPLLVSIIALIVMLLGYVIFIIVILQNSYASRVVEVLENQKIITNGLYSVVRHPMYMASIILFLSMPLVLGSCFALIPMIFYPFIIMERIKNEEILLVEKLDGYEDYMKKTKFRVIPFIW